MTWDTIEHWGNRAQLPLTIGGYIGWAYALWPKGAVLFGQPKDVNWQAVLAALIVMIGIISVSAQLAPWRRKQASDVVGAVPAATRWSNDRYTKLEDDDAKHIVERIHFEQPFRVEGTPQLRALDAYVQFSVGVRNSSVIPLELEREVEGRMRIDEGQELRERLEVSQYPFQIPIRHGTYQPIIFRQWLSAEAAAKIRHQRTTVFDAGKLAIYFTYQWREKRCRQRFALGNQVVWTNPEPEGWQALTAEQVRMLNYTAFCLGSHSMWITVYSDDPQAHVLAEQISAIFSGGPAKWKSQVIPYRNNFPQAHAGISIFGIDDQQLAHQMAAFLGVIFGEPVESILSLDKDWGVEILIVISPKLDRV